QDKLLIHELGNETLVYDLRNGKAHCLNRITAGVWKQCDGRKAVSGLATQLFPLLKVEEGAALVNVALEQLGRRELLETPLSALEVPSRAGRRDILRRLAASAVALPVAMSMLAPRAAQAASNKCPSGQTQCSGGCKNLKTDVNNCGSCGNV